MAIEFVDLLNPTQLTTALALIITVILTLIAYLGYRLRSPTILFFWALLTIVLMFTFITSLQFIWFWLVTMLAVAAVPIVAIVRYFIMRR